jgi:hypothetical protein
MLIKVSPAGIAEENAKQIAKALQKSVMVHDPRKGILYITQGDETDLLKLSKAGIKVEKVPKSS